MQIVMLQTITDSLNGGRTTQTFLKSVTYDLPNNIGQLWIGRGWARAAAAPARDAPARSQADGPARARAERAGGPADGLPVKQSSQANNEPRTTNHEKKE